MMKYLFGPVPSRRYGRSLGVDLAVPKTCTLSCRFCQLGPTPHTTVTRTAIPDIDAVWAELREWLAQGGEGLVLAAQRLAEGAEALGRVTGRVWSEELLDTVFGKFCVGK